MKEKEIIASSLIKLENWLKDHDYKGYDPADGLTSFLRPMTFGNLFLDRLLQQLIWRSPFNLRPLLGVKPLDSMIGRGYIARGYLLMYKIFGNIAYLAKAEDCLDWLIKNKAPDFEHFSWGKMFDFASRGGRQKKREPITVWTSLIGMAFLDAYETLGDTRYLTVADSVSQWILKVPRTITSSGSCIRYTTSSEAARSIHNQSMLAAWMLARTAVHINNPEYRSLAREAIEFTCSRQRSDGSWYYGEEPKFRWIDNFHTGYNLDALKGYIEITKDSTYEKELKLGFSYYLSIFFEKSGRPKYYHDRVYPIDSQCAAQSIDTLAFFSDYDDRALDLAVRVAIWTIKHMQDQTGYFYFMRYPHAVLKTPMIHWAQATTFKALAALISKL